MLPYHYHLSQDFFTLYHFLKRDISGDDNHHAMKYVKVLLITLTAIGFICWHTSKSVTRFDLPDGELKWSSVKPTNAKMCLPAAFTNENGKISGAYRYDGKNYQNGNALNMRVSLKEDMFYISRQWMSNNGFQQLTLVYNSKPMKFHDSRRAIRRALCKDEKGAFILQSNYLMTLTDFALECSKQSTNATYLDMGEYGYGYIKKNLLIRPLYIWGFFTRHKQTNWIYIE